MFLLKLTFDFQLENKEKKLLNNKNNDDIKQKGKLTATKGNHTKEC